MTTATAGLVTTQTLDIYADSSLFGLQVTDTSTSRTMGVTWSKRGGLLPPYPVSTIFWTPACRVPLNTITGHISFADTWTLGVMPEPFKSLVDIKVGSSKVLVMLNTATGASLYQATLDLSGAKLSILNG